jgi:hypothetical protein
MGETLFGILKVIFRSHCEQNTTPSQIPHIPLKIDKGFAYGMVASKKESLNAVITNNTSP